MVNYCGGFYCNCECLIGAEIAKKYSVTIVTTDVVYMSSRFWKLPLFGSLDLSQAGKETIVC